MSILPAQTIRRLCQAGWRDKTKGMRVEKRFEQPLIRPFVERGIFEGKSFGLSSCGYDVRLAQTLWVWPFWRRLGSTIEHFDIPDNLMGKLMNKSSWARLGIDASLTTNLEPGWKGYLTIEIVRHLPWPIRIKAGTPIAQVVFEELSEPTEQPYKGRYQNQQSNPQPAIKANLENLG